MQRYLKQVPDKSVACPVLSSSSIVLQMDATYWGRDFGVVIFMDASTHRVLHFRFLKSKERVSDYQAGIAELWAQGFEIRAIVSDALSGLKEAFPKIPYQYCQFHQLLRIRQLLTSNPRLPAARELKDLAQTLTQTEKERFEHALGLWEERWGEFLKEKTYGEEGRWHFTHRRTRSAFYSLKRNLDVLFTYENFPKNEVPRTNNAIEALNSVLKMKLRLHRGISTESRKRLIANLLTAYKPNKH